MLKRTLTHTHAYSQTHKHARASHTHTMNPNLLTYTQIHVCKHATHIVNRHTNLHAPSHTHTHTHTQKGFSKAHSHWLQTKKVKKSIGTNQHNSKSNEKKREKRENFFMYDKTLIFIWWSISLTTSIHPQILPPSLFRSVTPAAWGPHLVGLVNRHTHANEI